MMPRMVSSRMKLISFVYMQHSDVHASSYCVFSLRSLVDGHIRIFLRHTTHFVKTANNFLSLLPFICKFFCLSFSTSSLFYCQFFFCLPQKNVFVPLFLTVCNTCATMYLFDVSVSTMPGMLFNEVNAFSRQIQIK